MERERRPPTRDPHGRACAAWRDSDSRTRIREPLLLRLLLLATPIVLLWGVLVWLGLTPLRYDDLWVPLGAAFWAGVNGVFLAGAVRRIRATEFGANRRASVRFEVSGFVQLAGQPVEVRDLSLTGARVVVEAGGSIAVGTQTNISVPISRGAVTFNCVVRRVDQVGSADLIGLEFVDPDHVDQATLALSLFETGVTPTFDAADTTEQGLVEAA